MSQYLTIVFAAVLGACLGSFANVAAIRLHAMTSLGGRSRCPECDAFIRPRHLVPIFSWLALRGRCADCGAKIHVQYPLVELLCVTLVVIAALRHDPFFGNAMPFAFETFVSIALVVVLVMDLRWSELPVEVLVLVGIVGAFWNMFLGWSSGVLAASATSIAIGAGAGIIFFGAQWALSKGKWLGSGDVWFGAMMGLVLAWPATAYAIYLSYIFGGFGVGTLYILRKVKKGMRVPFAPALSMGLMAAFWFQPYFDQQLRFLFGI
ncbi:MAG: prepilin peptidase [Patescibacteria group bacterium]